MIAELVEQWPVVVNGGILYLLVWFWFGDNAGNLLLSERDKSFYCRPMENRGIIH